MGSSDSGLQSDFHYWLLGNHMPRYTSSVAHGNTEASYNWPTVQQS